MSEKRYTPGYIDVPGKGRRYRNASGEYFDNHFGSIVNSFGDAIAGIGEGYNNYYNATADAVGTERRDGTIKSTKTTKTEKSTKPEDKPTYRSRREGLDAVYPDRAVSTSTRQPDRTVTSPNTGNMPMSWAQYEVFLASKGIELANTKKQTSGYESINLPAGSEPITSTKVFQQDGIEFDSLYGGKLRQGDMTTPELKGLGTGMAENYRPGTYGLDPQSGASSLPDASDQSRALEVDQTKNRALPRGARQRQKFLERNPDYGRPEAPKIEKGTGISARGRAFLDAPMGAGPLELMRRTNAAQNILRKDGKIAIKDSEGNYNEISQEGYDKIRGDMRNQTEFSQEFLSQYLTTPAKPADAQSEDAVQPKPATKDLTTMAESYKPGYFPKELGFNISYNDEAPDIGLDPKLFSLARFQ